MGIYEMRAQYADGVLGGSIPPRFTTKNETELRVARPVWHRLRAPG